MKIEHLETYILGFFRKRGIEVTLGSIQTLLDRKYLNRELLDQMEPEEVFENVDVILNSIVRNRRAFMDRRVRAKGRRWKMNYLLRRSVQKRKISEKEITRVLKDYTGKLAPYGNYLPDRKREPTPNPGS